MTAPVERGSTDDRDLAELDDQDHREELRSRYYGLLQELRVVLPGVQVLLAFLLTVPFTQRFHDIDATGRALFAVALVAAALAVVCLLTPTLLHRMGERTARRERLQWAIRLTVAGTGCLGVSTVAALWCVTRMVYGSAVVTALVSITTTAIIVLWLVLPRTLDRS